MVLYRLYAASPEDWRKILEADAADPRKVQCYAAFEKTAEHYLEVRGFERRGRLDAPSCSRTGTRPTVPSISSSASSTGARFRLRNFRAAAWQSIFTADRGRYRRALVDRMHDYATLITGPSGTGKELVARAIGHARFLPFDPGTGRFASAPGEGFFPLNLSALSPTLIESELFGHKRGAFTGAVEDRSGWLEAAGSNGTVFLDEIGDLDAAIQVKLLRVLQSRSFQRLGETRERAFEGKVIAATNRDLGAEMQAGRFREDLYYRLCADRIETPSLRTQLEDHPGDLHNLVLVIARRLFGSEGDEIAAMVHDWVQSHLGADYAWPGNIRELEQCVRNVVIRGAYHPMATQRSGSAPSAGPRAALADEVVAGALDTEELLARYTALVYHQTGSYEEAARRLAIDRRTVKARIDRGFLAELEAGPSS